MNTQLLKAILSQTFEIQPKPKFTKHKLIRVSSQLGEFSIVNIISWFDPFSGICVGSCFLLWHLVQVLIAKKEEDQE
jgi:hypothetical protein